jgi:hypothetical protein
MINKKSPKLIKVRGMVMMISSGFNVAFSSPSTMATPTGSRKTTDVHTGKHPIGQKNGNGAHNKS